MRLLLIFLCFWSCTPSAPESQYFNQQISTAANLASEGPAIDEQEACNISRRGDTSFSHDDLLKKLTKASKELFCNNKTNSVYKPCLKAWEIEKTRTGDLNSILAIVEKDIEKTPLGMCQRISFLTSQLASLINYKNVEVTLNDRTLSIKTHEGYQSYAYPAATDETQQKIDFWLSLKSMSSSQVRDEINSTYQKLSQLQVQWDIYHQKMLQHRSNCKITAVAGGSQQVEIDKNYNDLFSKSKKGLQEILSSEEIFYSIETTL